MEAPSPDDIQEWTKQPALKTAEPDEAERTVARAVSDFRRMTGLDLAGVPDEDAPSVERAIQGLSELLTVQQSEDYLETLADWDLLSSFSAGAYSESRRSPEEAVKARMLVAWPWLSNLLWDLMTDDKRDEYLELSGAPVPAFEVQEVDWEAGQIPYITGYPALADSHLFWGDR